MSQGEDVGVGKSPLNLPLRGGEAPSPFPLKGPARGESHSTT